MPLYALEVCSKFLLGRDGVLFLLLFASEFVDAPADCTRVAEPPLRGSDCWDTDVPGEFVVSAIGSKDGSKTKVPLSAEKKMLGIGRSFGGAQTHHASELSSCLRVSSDWCTVLFHQQIRQDLRADAMSVLLLYPPLLRRSTIDEAGISQTWIDCLRCECRLSQFESERCCRIVVACRRNPHRVEDFESR